MVIDRSHALAAFRAYVSQFDENDPKIALKITHTQRVADLCERIAASIGLSQADCDRAWLAGILHDVGRFEQVRNYGVFADARSVNHALLSAQIVFDNGLLESFISLSADDAEDCAVLRLAIEQHNALTLPDGLSRTEWLLSTILRDADKIDIFRVACVHSLEDIYAFTRAELRASSLSPVVCTAFNCKAAIPTSLKKQPADIVLGHCAMTWELVFAESRRIALEEGYLAKLMGQDFTNPETNTFFRHAAEDLARYLTGKEGLVRPLVIFDFDGTLVDSLPQITHIARQALLEFGMAPEQIGDLRRLVGPPFPQAFVDVYGVSSADAASITARYREIYYDTADDTKAFPDIAALLKRLAETGRRVAIASSKNDRMLAAGLERTGLAPLIDYRAGKTSDAQATKTACILRAVESLGFAPADAIMVGDRFYDVRAARAAGMPCIGVEYGGTAAPFELASHGAYAIASTVEELGSLLIP